LGVSRAFLLVYARVYGDGARFPVQLVGYPPPALFSGGRTHCGLPRRAAVSAPPARRACGGRPVLGLRFGGGVAFSGSGSPGFAPVWPPCLASFSWAGSSSTSPLVWRPEGLRRLSFSSPSAVENLGDGGSDTLDLERNRSVLSVRQRDRNVGRGPAAKKYPGATLSVCISGLSRLRGPAKVAAVRKGYRRRPFQAWSPNPGKTLPLWPSGAAKCRPKKQRAMTRAPSDRERARPARWVEGPRGGKGRAEQRKDSQGRDPQAPRPGRPRQPLKRPKYSPRKPDVFFRFTPRKGGERSAPGFRAGPGPVSCPKTLDLGGKRASAGRRRRFGPAG